MSEADRVSIKNQMIRKNKEYKIARSKFYMVRADYPLFKAVRTFKVTLKKRRDAGDVLSKETKDKYKRLLAKLVEQVKQTPEWKALNILGQERNELRVMFDFLSKVSVE